MKIYSPSQTKLFMECPQKWLISRRHGWQRKWLRKGDVAACVGQLIGKVLATGEDAARVEADFTAMMQAKQQQGFIIEDDVWAKFDSYRPVLPKVINKYLTSPGRIDPAWTGIQLEYNVSTTDDHNAYIDVCGIEADGSHFIWDFKCKMYLKSTDQASELLSYRQDWQMMHYGWFYWKKTGVLPSRYYIGMPVLGPTPAFVGGNDPQGLGIFSYDEHALQAWYDSACIWWQMMEQCEQQDWAPMSAQHTGRYGNCEYYDACFTYHQQPDMMTSGYIQIQRA